MSVGYTKAQAWKIKNGIDLDMAAIEARVAKMSRRVPDHHESGFFGSTQLEEMRESAEYLKAIVDRRTRR